MNHLPPGTIKKDTFKSFLIEEHERVLLGLKYEPHC